MGAADLVPGVSGGTVALLFGVYENLLKQISKLFTILSLLARFNFKSARKELRNVDWQFLCSLGIGIGIAVVTLAAWLSRQIEDHPVQLSAIFFWVDSRKRFTHQKRDKNLGLGEGALVYIGCRRSFRSSWIQLRVSFGPFINNSYFSWSRGHMRNDPARNIGLVYSFGIRFL